jgi:hypothetical protein
MVTQGRSCFNLIRADYPKIIFEDYQFWLASLNIVYIHISNIGVQRMPLSRLNNLVSMTAPVDTIPPTGLIQCGAPGLCALRFCCTERRYPSASKTTGRNTTESASRIAAGAQARQHMHSGRFAAVPPNRDPIAKGLGLGAAANPFASRRYELIASANDWEARQ